MMCGSEAFISGQQAYNDWIRNHRDMFDGVVDNTEQSPKETAAIIRKWIERDMKKL